MGEELTCPQGHQWRASGNGVPGDLRNALGEMLRRNVCPVCGEAALTLEAPPLTANPQALTLPITPQAPDRPAVPGYEIQAELGRGGMGVVYRAWQTSLKRTVALKMIRGGLHAGPEDLERFRSEAEAVARLQHPNIVQIHEVGEYRIGDEGSRPFFSLEYVDGGSLAQWLAQRLKSAPESPARAAELVETLARAVHAAHQRGIIHRDLKPANVLLTANGTPKIADFGLAKQLDDDATRTRSGAILGTPSYMAPEQAAGKIREITTATDVYALGAILYELIAGRPPFRGETMLETLEQVRSQEPVSPSRLQPRLPRDLVTICLKCLQKEPRQRYGSAEALADDLRRFRNHESILARPVGGLERTYRWCRRNPAAVAIMAVLLISVLAVTGTGWWSYHAVREQLHESLYQQARALWLAREPGWREQSLTAIKKAAAIRRDARLRDLAVQTLVSWDFRLEKELSVDPQGTVSCLAVRPDGREVAAGVGPTVQFWDSQTGVWLAALSLGREHVGGLSYHSERPLLACATGHDVVVLNTQQRTEVHRLGPHEEAVRAVSFGPGHEAVASTDGAQVYVWDLRDGRLLCREPIASTAEEIKTKPKMEKPEGGILKPVSFADPRTRIPALAGTTTLLLGQGFPQDSPLGAPPAAPTPVREAYPHADLVASVRSDFLVVATPQGPPVMWKRVGDKLVDRAGLPLPRGPNVRLALSADEQVLFLACNDPSEPIVPAPAEVIRPKPAPAPEKAPKPAEKPQPSGAHKPSSRRRDSGPWYPMLATLLQQPGAQPVQPVQPVDTAPTTALAAPTSGVSVPAGLFGPTGGAPAQEASPSQQAAAHTPGANVVSGVEAVSRATSDAGVLGRLGPELGATVCAYQLADQRRNISYVAALGQVRGIVAGADGMLFVPGDSGRVGLFRFQRGELERAGEGIWDAGVGELAALVRSPAGSQVATASKRYPIRLWRWEGVEFSEIVQFRVELSEIVQFRVDDWCEFGLDSTGRFLAVAPWNGELALRNLSDSRPPLSIAPGGLRPVAVSPDGRQLFYVRRTGPVGLFAARHNQRANGTAGLVADEPVPIPKDAPFRLLNLALSPDGRHLALAGKDPPIVIRSSVGPDYAVTASFGPSDFWFGPDVLVGVLGYSPDGTLLAGAATDGAVHVWRTKDGSPAGRLAHSPHAIASLAWSPDNRLLAGGTEDGHIVLWDVAEQRETAKLRAGGAVSALAFAADGTRFVSGDRRGHVWIWDVAAQRPIAGWKGHTAEVAKLMYRDADRDFLSCARNGEVYRWRLDRIREGLRDLGLDW